MKKIPISSINLETAIPLFSTRTGTKIWRLAIDQYAILGEGNNIPAIAFESKNFSCLIDQFTENIADIAIIGCNEFEEDNEPFFVELRILLEDGSAYLFNRDDNALEIIRMEFEDLDESPAPTPCGHWAMPKLAPFKHMLITPKLAKKISKMGSTTPISEILKRMWLETGKLRDPHFIGQVAYVDGEFIKYAAKECRCGRILFMKKSETDDYAPMADRP
jgi:hypothetical protein